MNKRFSILVIICIILLTACGSSPSSSSVQPTATVVSSTATNTSTSTPEPTFTPTVTPTPRLPVSSGTQIPNSVLSLSADNLDQVVELARWGKGVITDAVYSPDGKLIAIATTLGVSIYQADTLEETHYIDTNASVNSLAFSPDGETLATGLNDNTAKIWKAADGTLIKSFDGHIKLKTDRNNAGKSEVTSVVFSPDGNLLAVGSTDGTVSLWQVSDSRLALTDTRSGETGVNISCVLFSHDGQSLFSASWDGTVHMTNVSDGQLIKTFSGGHDIIDATISADGKMLAAYDATFYDVGGSLILWNIEDGKKLQTIKGGNYYSTDIKSIALSPDGQFVAAGWDDHTAKIWSVASGTLQSTFEDMQPKDGWYYYTFSVVAFSPDSQSLLMTDSNVIGIWDVQKGSLLNSAKIKSEGINDIAISPDGQILASAEGPNVNLSQIFDGSIHPSQEPMQSNGSLAFSLDGTSLLVSMFDETARLWPVSDEGVRKTFEMEKKEYIEGVAFSPDGKIIALGTGYPAGKVELRQAADGLLLNTLSLDTTYGFGEVAFSPNGELLGVSINDQIKLYRVSDGKFVKSFKGVYNMAFSPDSTLVAGGADDKTVRVWKIPEGESLLTINDLSDQVYSVVFSPDGTLLVSGDADGIIEVFLASDGTLLKTWKAHSNGISDLKFSTDAKLLISSSYDGTIRTWGIKP